MDSDFYRRRAQNKLIVIAILISCGVALYWYFSPVLSVKKLVGIQSSIEDFALTQIKKQISTPPPLRVALPKIPTASPSVLTRSGIISESNVQRNENGGLPALAENAVLDNIAKLRLQDMFQKQYFAHVAPDGGGAEKLAKTVGYEYLSFGENLALGNYAGDGGVVTAWMNSPGHRANILNSHYTEIGVAAAKGIFEGEDTWIAVQIFGRPAADCPSPEASLKIAIDSAELQLSQIETELQAEKADLNSTDSYHGPAYNQKVDAYNALVAQYNVLVAQTKAKISAYNTEVGVFNRCTGS